MAPEKNGKTGSFTELATSSPRDLWLIFALKALWGLAEFSLASVLVLFLSDDLKMTDTDAGWVYGLTGLVKALYGLVCGFTVDLLGVRRSLLAGAFLMTLGLAIVASAHSSIWAISALLTLKGFGSALLLNPMMFAVRRYTNESTRPYAFSLFYVVMNASAFLAQLLVNAVRNSKSATLLPMVHWLSPTAELSLWRLVIWVAVISGAMTFFLSLLIREVPAASHAEDSQGNASEKNAWSMMKLTVSESKFWRLCALCAVFIGVRLIFVHMHATFPKFLTREIGADAPFELIIAINPACIMVFVPCFTSLIENYHWGSYPVLLLGAAITAISPVPLAYDEDSYLAAIAFIVLLSVGEALWSPKLYEHTVAVSPVGREGTYGALAVAPLFASFFFAGGFSGHLLQAHCPSSGHCDGFTIWMLVSLTTATSPLVLLFCKSCLFHEDDWVKETDIAKSNESYGTCSQSSEPVAPA